MSFVLVEQLQQKAVPVDQLCRVLEVSRSGYYAARKRRHTAPAVCEASVQLKAAFAASGGAYGSRRLRSAVASRGIVMGRYRVRSLMRQHGLRPVWKRKFVHTTDSRHALPIWPNVLDRQFNPTRPNQAWVADITYIRTRSGWLYLAVVLDLFARKVVGWAMAPDMRATLVCQALQLAIAQRQPAPGLIVHSDRGSQYASDAHRALLARHGLVGSMSRKGNCWDNSVMERFFLNLKMERVWQNDYANHAEAMSDVADYIVGFYNSVRLHSTLGNLPPNAFEQKSAINQPINVSEITWPGHDECKRSFFTRFAA
jgi:putative transposase